MTTDKFKIKPTKKASACQVRLNENLESRYRMIASALGVGTTYTRNTLTEQMHNGKLEYELEVGNYTVIISAPLSEITEETLEEIKKGLKQDSDSHKSQKKKEQVAEEGESQEEATTKEHEPDEEENDEIGF